MSKVMSSCWGPGSGLIYGWDEEGVGTAMELSKRLLHEAHVVTVPGEAFGTEEHIRLSYAT